MVVFVSTVEIFPTQFVATAFGFCNIGCHLLSIGAPMVAEMDAPIPMTVFSCLNCLAFLLTFGLILKD
jgi:hypothetical protein